MIPPLPDLERLADAVRLVAGREGFDPAPVEKDFYLTRVIWGLAEALGEALVLKGGTCLSKVDYGFRRMSEDADFVLPWSGGTRHRAMNAAQTNRVARTLVDLAPALGLTLESFDGEEHDRRSHVLWTLHYPARFGPGAIVVEAAMRPVLRPARYVQLRQLLDGRVGRLHDGAYGWAMDPDEVRAEKIRAAFTRRVIRDFYDLSLFVEHDADLVSPDFVALVDAKLAEADALPLHRQRLAFGLTQRERDELRAAIPGQLVPVLRRTEPAFDLDAVIDHYDRIWTPIRTD
ncbi:MAG TPA: nucleotidyl transferase AbiEii/AbiGii toxin family protein [Chloroflexota bacterium]|nr:nucleotidyl transferase AbiEii/AbiGii toxin family protein [Chloroflexota bacterium]